MNSDHRHLEIPPLTFQRFCLVLYRYFPFLWPYKAQLILLFILLPTAGSLLVVVLPFCSQLLLDVAFPLKDLTVLFLLTFLGVGAILAERTLVVFIRGVVSSHLRIRFLGSVGSRLYHSILRFSMRYHHNTPIGEKIYRCDTDLIDTAEMFGFHLPMMIQYALQFLVTVTTMCFINWRPVALAGLCAPLFFIIAQVIFNAYRNVDLKRRNHGQRLTTRLEESLSGIDVVYSHGCRKRESISYRRVLSGYTFLNMFYGFLNEVVVVLVWPTGMPAILADFIVSIYSGILVIRGDMSIGEWSAIKLLIVQAIIPLGILISYYQSLRLRMVPAERILQLLDLQEKIETPTDAIRLQPLKGKIEFRDVHFQYTPDKPVLQGISFSIEPGEKVAFVGPSGIGKTTIINLILRFYDPDQGEILIDGIDLKKVDLQTFRRQTGLVLQEPFLFSRSIYDNICYGLHQPSTKAFVHATHVARVDEIIRSIPEGFNARIGKDTELALGQRQQITVARCLAHEPHLILLDEPTSLLDPQSRQVLLETLNEVTRDRTSVIISHDLRSVRDADCIHVLNQGVIVESGKHDELVQKGGLYASYWTLQEVSS